jgi:hypothetical protein
MVLAVIEVPEVPTVTVLGETKVSIFREEDVSETND